MVFPFDGFPDPWVEHLHGQGTPGRGYSGLLDGIPLVILLVTLTSLMEAHLVFLMMPSGPQFPSGGGLLDLVIFVHLVPQIPEPPGISVMQPNTWVLDQRIAGNCCLPSRQQISN